MSTSIKIRARRWLDDNEFKEILKIADYIRFERGRGGVFTLNPRKIKENKYDLIDIINLINDLGLEVEGGIESLKSLFKVKIAPINETNEILVEIPWNIWHIHRDLFKEKLQGRFYGKTKDAILVTIKPWLLHKLVNSLRQYEYVVEDPSGLSKDKYLPIKLSFLGELRPYQKEAIDSWINNGFRGIIALPTGAGKTIVAIAGLVALNRRTLIVTYTKEQMFQWKDMIKKFTDTTEALIGLYYGEEKRLSPITITTYQSAFRNMDLLGKYFDLLIVDECHHLPADKFRYIAMHSTAPYRMGLSATVTREDGKHVELFPLMGDIVYHKTAAELAVQGYLARYRIHTIKVGLTPEEKREYAELAKLYKSLAGGKSFQEVLESAKRGDQKAQYALKVHSRIRMLLALSKSKINKAVEIALKELKRNNKIIIFTQYVNQAKELSEKLGAYLLTGNIDTKERKRILDEFRSSRKGVLVVTTVGDEGLDIPDASIGIIVSGTGSRRQFIQRLGRLLRPKPGKEAILYEIIITGTPDEASARRRKSILDSDSSS